MRSSEVMARNAPPEASGTAKESVGPLSGTSTIVSDHTGARSNKARRAMSRFHRSLPTISRRRADNSRDNTASSTVPSGVSQR